MSKFPVPGMSRTRATASLRRPVVIFAAVVATYDSSLFFLAVDLRAVVLREVVFFAVDFEAADVVVLRAVGFFVADFFAGDLAPVLAAVFGLAEGFFAAGLSGVGAVVPRFVGRGCFSGNPSQPGGWPNVYGTGCCA